MAISATPTTETVVPDQSTQLTASAVFDLLSNARRRSVLTYLREQEEASVRELSRHIAAWENDVEPSAVSSTQRKRVYTALHQTHLPRLDDYGVVEHDRDRGVVRATSLQRVFDTYLDHNEDPSGAWLRYYAGTGVAGTVLGLGVALGVPGLAAFPAGLLALLVGLVVLGLVGLQRRTAADGEAAFPDLQPAVRTPADD